MGAIDKFMRSRGYAKLDRYGLVLTPDDRVLSTRPAVLDDGLGGKIVGWVDGDLAAMELDRWGVAAKPAPAKPVAALPMAQPRPVATQRPLPGVAPIADPAPAPAPVIVVAPHAPVVAPPAPMVARPAPPIAPPTPLFTITPPVAFAPPPPVVAAEPVVEEDEWEWEIVMARARAVAEEVQTAATSMAFTKPKAPAPKAPPGPRTMPMAVVAPKPEPVPVWQETKTEQAAHSWSDITEASASAPTKEHQRPTAIPVPSMASANRSTVIPVPQLPVAANPSDVRPLPHPTRTVSGRTRIARGTGRESVQTAQMPSVRPTDDPTSPYITLPPEVKAPAGYASAKLVAAKQR